MKSLVTATILALAIAAPAFAQAASGQGTSQATPSEYMQQAARLEAAAQALPGGGDERTQDNLEWRALVAKANADRVAHEDSTAASSRPTGAVN